MAQHLLDLLDTWLPTYQQDWVLAVITQVEGSSYRKPGAIMLFHPLGKSLGMLSGGCLEADLRRNAQRAIQTQEVIQLIYDASDESDTSYQLGCGGIVHIMMVSLTKTNHYLGLLTVHDALMKGLSGYFNMTLAENGASCDAISGQFIPSDKDTESTISFKQHANIEALAGANCLHIPIKPPVNIGIFGGGLDAQPLAQMAQTLGWRVTVFDERTAYARQYDFPGCQIIKHEVALIDKHQFDSLDAAFIMHHSLTLDAKALSALIPQNLKYIALLGPTHRRDRVVALCDVNLDNFSGFFSAPAGLALGGELPSAIALSMLAQCHGVLHQSQLVSLDKVML